MSEKLDNFIVGMACFCLGMLCIGAVVLTCAILSGCSSTPTIHIRETVVQVPDPLSPNGFRWCLESDWSCRAGSDGVRV